ncbi:hypothetical protein OGAPHI_000143 [Ogataea philodendri]|uniref:Uncharacterized protein n=1 Tax=Ogataea philodendri TaxID=1378263 RepID=A0A9P8PH36_9ASCO|nr:uncharacterized protein OGAPHI_000143 [Ogataea philodendri]KAH3671957.1 hypothetical protein OGAPHI_000143 [Ogataea philodendri]
MCSRKRQRRDSDEDSQGDFTGDVGDAINEKIRQTEQNVGSYIQGPFDPIFGQRRAFPVILDLNSIDKNEPMNDVNTYLAMVRMEAQQFERHGFDSAPREKTEADVEEPHIEPDQDGYKANPLLTDFLVEFKTKRKEYEEYRSTLTDIDAIELPQTQKEWKYVVFNNEPTFDIMAQLIEEDEIIKLAVYFTKWLNRDVNPSFENWIFHLLYAIDDVLNASDVSVLRALAKKALKQAEGQLDERNQLIMDKIVTIVGSFYGQKDLLM